MRRRRFNRKMDPSLRRTERFYVRTLLIVVATVVVLVGGGWSAAHFYNRWQEHRFMRQAHTLFR